MSAYLCDQDTINAIATFAADHGLVADAALFADLLTLTNVAAMKARYPGREWLQRDVIDVAAGYVFERVEWSAHCVAEQAKAYDYQACEVDDYDATLCARLVNRVLRHAENVAELEAPGGCGAMRFPRFFSIDDGKAVKAQKNARGWLNAINYMAPAATAGVGNLCPHASAGCKALCLGAWSGQAGMRLEGEDNSVTLSRKAKARYFMEERQAFLREMEIHIGRARARAKAEGRRLCVRLNGSTDIAFENAKVGGAWIMDSFGDVQFVDYTKSFARMMSFCDGKAPRNYHLTFSRSEDNESDCVAVLKAGGNVAVVSSMARPKAWRGFRTIDGDRHDLRHLDGDRSVVVWLSPKGNKAKRDTSGFVLRAR
jgi:hypothetical protein